MKIVYMGTPDFAVPPLAALVQNGYEVTAVVTQPDKPKGRGQDTSADTGQRRSNETRYSGLSAAQSA